jgi:hypothetical protein
MGKPVVGDVVVLRFLKQICKSENVVRLLLSPTLPGTT